MTIFYTYPVTNPKKEDAVQSWNDAKDDTELRLSKMSTKLEEEKEQVSDKWGSYDLNPSI